MATSSIKSVRTQIKEIRKVRAASDKFLKACREFNKAAKELFFPPETHIGFPIVFDVFTAEYAKALDVVHRTIGEAGSTAEAFLTIRELTYKSPQLCREQKDMVFDFSYTGPLLDEAAFVKPDCDSSLSSLPSAMEENLGYRAILDILNLDDERNKKRADSRPMIVLDEAAHMSPAFWQTVVLPRLEASVIQVDPETASVLLRDSGVDKGNGTIDDLD